MMTDLYSYYSEASGTSTGYASSARQWLLQQYANMEIQKQEIKVTYEPEPTKENKLLLLLEDL